MSGYFLVDSSLGVWQLGVNDAGIPVKTPVASGTDSGIVLRSGSGSYFSLGINTSGEFLTAATSSRTPSLVLLASPKGTIYQCGISNLGELLSFPWTANYRIGIFSKDAVLFTGAFMAGIPIEYGLYDDDFVAQFAGTSAGATVLGIAPVPVGVFSKDFTLDGAFDA